MGLKKSILLLSGGLDSTVNFFQAVKETEVLLNLTFDYGQKAAAKEIAAAAYFSQCHHIPHKVISIPWIKDWNKSSLIDLQAKIPTGQEVQIDELNQSKKTAQSVWVPNRNGIFLNIAAGFAEVLNADIVIPGFNAEEAVTFPDNSENFLSILNQSFSYSTANHVKVQCYTIHENKTEIVKRALAFGVEFDKLWFCYFAGDKWCGECESCKRAKRALHDSGIHKCDHFFKKSTPS
jgi:7-cyano-7-deazaguanine synthase